MASVIAQHSGPWCFEELAGLPEDPRRFEVVDGNLVVTPPPSQGHQWISNLIVRRLAAAAPADWVPLIGFALPLGTDGRVPDFAVVRADAPLPSASPYPLGPEWFGLVGEVVSPSSRKTDRFAKPGEYAEAGIAIYWRVELEPDVRVHAFELLDGAYVETDRLVVPWGVLDPDLDLDPFLPPG